MPDLGERDEDRNRYRPRRIARTLGRFFLLGQRRGPIEKAPWCTCGLSCLRSSTLSDRVNEVVHETVLIGAGKIALDELARGRLSLIRHLFAQFLPGHFYFLFGKKIGVFLNFYRSRLGLPDNFAFFSLAFVAQGIKNRLNFSIETGQLGAVFVHQRLGRLFSGGGLADRGNHLVVARLEEISD